MDCRADFSNRACHSSLFGGLGFSGWVSFSFSFDEKDFRKFFIPSPKDFPSSGSFLAPKMKTTIRRMIISSGGPIGPNRNIITSFKGFFSLLSFYQVLNKVTLVPVKSQASGAQAKWFENTQALY